MKIKKLLIIIFLTFSFTFASFHYHQKRAEAIAPWVLWAAINVIPSIVIGAVLYLTRDSGDVEMATVSTVDSQTGQVNLDQIEMPDGTAAKIWTVTWNGVKVYPTNSFITPPGMSINVSRTNIQLNQSVIDNQYDIASSQNEYCEYMSTGFGGSVNIRCYSDGINANYNDVFHDTQGFELPFDMQPVSGGLGNVNTGEIEGNPVELYDFLEDVPQLPDCFDGIQNQDETGIDCGGVCLQNFGFECPPAESCFDGIMNQDETGIDYGGVCGTGTPVSQPPANFTDNNQDGIDDISGLDSTGAIPVGTVSGSVGNADSSTYDASLPGDVSEVGETDWTGLITGYLASNPLVLLATGSQINVTGATCSLPLTLFGKSMTIDFCSLDWMVDLFGSFVLGLMAIRAVFIALGV